MDFAAELNNYLPLNAQEAKEDDLDILIRRSQAAVKQSVESQRAEDRKRQQALNKQADTGPTVAQIRAKALLSPKQKKFNHTLEQLKDFRNRRN